MLSGSAPFPQQFELDPSNQKVSLKLLERLQNPRPGADESSWDNVSALLKAKGYTVSAVRLPLTSLADDVAATQAILNAQDGPAVLVGHSWSGFVIGDAGVNPNVTVLVYVSAFAPDKGESVNTLSANGQPSHGVHAIRPDDKGFRSIDKAAFPKPGDAERSCNREGLHT